MYQLKVVCFVVATLDVAMFFHLSDFIQCMRWNLLSSINFLEQT